jgi:hypothetical protein
MRGKTTPKLNTAHQNLAKKIPFVFSLEIGKFCSTKHGIYDIIVILLNDF